MTWLPLEALDDIPTFLRRRNASWRLQARLLRIAHIVLGVCATAMAVAAGVLVDKENGGRVGQMLAFAAGAASAVLAFFSVESKGNRMRNAERILTAALMRFEISDKGSDDLRLLVDAYELGEQAIGDVVTGMH